jgi:class 3 adenylate cyclase
MGSPPPLYFEARRTFRVRPEAIWPFVADTERLNRVVGLPPMRYATRPRAGGGTQAVAEYVLGPLPLVRWDEAPFEWEYARFYEVVRDYHWGPLRRFEGGVRLEPVGEDATVVLFWASMTPRHVWWIPLVKYLLGSASVASGIRQCVFFERYLLGEIDDPFPQLRPQRGLMRLVPIPLCTAFLLGRRSPPAHRSPGETGMEADRPPDGCHRPRQGAPAPAPLPVAQDDEVRGAWQELARQAGSAALVARLRRHLLQAPDQAVARMRPFELADRWGADRRETLILFLRATTAGLLQMSWDLLCPNCRLAKAQFAALTELRAEAHCDVCDITYDANFDRNVEVRFTVAPALRQVKDRTFCIGGPMTAPHVLARLTVGPGATAELGVRLEAGHYRLRSRQSRGTVAIDAMDPTPGPAPTRGAVERARSRQGTTGTATGAGPGPNAPDHPAPPARGPLGEPLRESALPLRTEAGPGVRCAIDVAAEAMEPHTLEVEAGEVVLSLTNRLDVPATVDLARRDWPDTAVTAALVSTFQEFRDLFSSEVLAPGIQVAIERLAFLFTDLSGSTAMYQAAGQARAFRIVQDHFRILFGAINEHRGAVVKTIGDAVMAVFPTAAAALDAALAIQRGIRSLDTGGVVDTTTLVKVGIHQGPAVAVNANGRLDYFGTSVNIASRVEHACRGGEITISADIRLDPAVAARLASAGFQLEADVVALRGIREPVPLCRILNPVP